MRYKDKRQHNKQIRRLLVEFVPRVYFDQFENARVGARYLVVGEDLHRVHFDKEIIDQDNNKAIRRVIERILKDLQIQIKQREILKR